MDPADPPLGPTDPAQLLHALERAHDIVLLLDDRGRIRYANESAVRAYGYSRAALHELTIHALDSDFPASAWEQHWQSLKRKGTLTVTVRHRASDGRVFPVEISDTWQQLAGTEYSLVIARDLSHRPGSKARAKLMQFSIDHMGESVFWINPDGVLEYANDAACRNLGYAHDELIGRTVFEIDPNFPVEIWPLHWEELRERQRLVFETEHRHRDGRIFPVEVSAHYLQLGDHAYNCAFARDIRARKAAEGQLRHMATHDPLTALPNRTLLGDRLAQGLASAVRGHTRLGVLFLDLDGLQSVNLDFGHAVGDELLGAVARRLQSVLRAADTVARWGNDQFVVLIPDLEQLEHAIHVARKLLDTLRMPLPLGTRTLEITASIGIALFPDDGQDAETLCKNADIAMYRAKEFGGDTVQYFSADLNPDTAEHVRTLMEMRRALDNDEFAVYYQPIADLQTLRPSAIEALARWQHPLRGLLNPECFIAAAEETGFILDLGARVMQHAVTGRQLWADRAPGIPLSINLSLRQLRDPDLLPFVERLLECGGLTAEQLMFELPPQLLAADNAAYTAPARQLAELGVRLCIDEVGRMPTHIGLLQRLPLDLLKLDRVLIGALGNDPHALPLVEALTAAAHRLDTRVLAVGVADPRLLEQVREAGCDLAQGFAIAPPMDGAALGAWLSGWDA